MNTPQQPPPALTLPNVRIEVRGGELVITPANKPNGAEVVIDIQRLDRWAAKIYREEVLA